VSDLVVGDAVHLLDNDDVAIVAVVPTRVSLMTEGAAEESAGEEEEGAEAASAEPEGETEESES
jgi:hypothetical protein